MRLRTIALKNFGAFKDVIVDLSGISAAVVRGMNGAGKSTAFIDGVTWVLFGICRIPTDEIMRLGTDEMVGTVVFDLNGQRYRVIRRRSVKTKAGKSDLELQLITPSDDPQVLSGARLADTQEKICQLLNLDYELLTATGILVQGQADRFTKSTPGERKVILSQILRLDQYPRLKSAASTVATTISVRRDGQVAEATAANVLAATLDGLVTDRITITQQAERARADIATQTTLTRDLHAQLATLQAQLNGRTALCDQLAACRQKQTDLGVRQRQRLERQLRAQKILANKDTIAAKAREETELRALVLLLDGERETLAQDTTALVQEQSDIRGRLTEGLLLERRTQELQYIVNTEIQAFARETDRLQTELQRHLNAVGLLVQVPCGADLQRQCQFTAEAMKSGDRIPVLREQLATRVLPQEATDRLRESLAQLQAWVGLGWEKVEQRVADQIRAAEAQSASRVRRRRDADAALARVAEFTQLVPELEVATRELQQIETDLAVGLFDADALEREVEALVQQQADASRAAERLAAVQSQLTVSVVVEAGHRRVLEDCNTQLGQVDERIRRAEQAQLVVAELTASVAQARGELRQYQQLMKAYEQIPVLIMESAIPMLELEANAMLGRISRSGMKVRLDTQKTLKSRDGLAETLDIWVRDVHGERRYEAYSGGEKFRLDLALRIGLSKLLSHRAGATLDTLVIDEGLGSLDPEALAQVRECLAELQQAFPLLLVITHVEAMQHTFPSQIVVTEGTDGSAIEVLA